MGVFLLPQWHVPRTGGFVMSDDTDNAVSRELLVIVVFVRDVSGKISAFDRERAKKR